MTFADKLKFWKKDDDMDFNTGLPPMDDSFGSSTPTNSSLEDSFDNPLGTSGSLPESQPFGSPDISQPKFGSPAQQPQPFPNISSSQSPQSLDQQPSFDPLTNPSQADSPGSFGQKLAHDYITQEQSSTKQENSPAKNTERELVQLKLDAIRSELNAMSQRIIKIEHLLEKKQRGW